MARLEKGKIVELDFEFPGQSPSLLGAIYYGRVIEIQRPLSVAFVDIGEKKPGMLPFKGEKTFSYQSRRGGSCAGKPNRKPPRRERGTPYAFNKFGFRPSSFYTFHGRFESFEKIKSARKF
jgi:Ribonuclease G/E